ncbi:hypothetical protein KM043_005789 [Ampulex compressa]|nr:hypothetical protein KM043_005789 [Ampulex compressa]
MPESQGQSVGCGETDTDVPPQAATTSGLRFFGSVLDGDDIRVSLGAIPLPRCSSCVVLGRGGADWDIGSDVRFCGEEVEEVRLFLDFFTVDGNREREYAWCFFENVWLKSWV